MSRYQKLSTEFYKCNKENRILLRQKETRDKCNKNL